MKCEFFSVNPFYIPEKVYLCAQKQTNLYIMIRKSIWLVGILLVGTLNLLAQVPRLFSIQQGLPNSRIVDIYFDRENLLWICSEYGLMTFDGHNFTTYKAEKGNAYALQDNYVNCVYNDEKQRYWVGTGDGLYLFDKKKNAFLRQHWRGTDAVISVTDIRTDPQMQNALLVATSGNGINYIDAKTFVYMQEQSEKMHNLLHTTVIEKTYIDSEHRLWVTGKTGITLLSPNRNKKLKFKGDATLIQLLKESMTETLLEYPPLHSVLLGSERYGILACDTRTLTLRRIANEQLSRLPVTKLLMDNQQRLFIGTENDGLYRYSPSSDVVEDNLAERGPIDLVHTKIHNMTFDAQGNLWLGLYRKGLLLFPQREKQFSMWRNSTYVQGGPEGYVTRQCQLSDGSLVTTMDGGGVSILSPTGTRTQYHAANSIMEANSVMALAQDDADNLFVGTYGYGIYYLPKGGVPCRLPELNVLNSTPIMSIITDARRERLYIATNGAGVYVYDILQRVLTPFPYQGNAWVSSLCLSTNGHLWIGTASGAVDVDLKTHKSREMRTSGKNLARYFCLQEVDGRIYAGTSEGLLVNQPGQNVMLSVPSKERYDLGDIMAMTTDNEQKLWFSTTDCLYSYNIVKQEICRHNAPAITLAGNFNPRSVFKSASGDIYFGGDDGVVAFSPKDIERKSTVSPGRIYITGLSVDNVRTDYQPDSESNITDSAVWYAHKITIPYEVNSLRINFGILNYANAMNIRYEYRLLGISENWIQIPNNQEYAILTKLHSGTYRFQVKAYVEGNPEVASTKEIAIVVLPPWWATWWAYLIYIALLCMVAWYIYRFYKAKFDKRQQIRLRSLYLMDLRLKLPIPQPQRKKEESISVLLAGTPRTLTAHLKNALDGYDLRVAESAEAAREMLEVHKPHVVIVDFSLGDCSGMEFCNSLKNGEKTKDIPLILLTTERTDELEELAIKCKVDRFIQRPVNFALLHAAIEGIYEKERAVDESMESSAKPTFEEQMERHKDVSYDYSQLKIDSTDDKLMTRVVDVIRKNMSNSEFGVEDLSREVGMSRVHLNRKMKELTGTTPNALIKSIRLKQAAFLLVNNHLNVSEVAYTVGFNTPSYFTTNFTAFFGMSPKDFMAAYSVNPKDDKFREILEKK
jgi:ligand-binding sensor domain-containing protein/AraC-like DNA-binding protein/CheY-like chemotaxis protein